MFRLLIVISVSYWYCLPVVTQSLLGYNEFRGYDFLMFVLIMLLVTKHRAALRAFYRRDKPGRWLLRFCTWATATLPVTAVISIVNGRAFWTMVTAVFLFHLWGFSLTYAAVRMFIRTRSQCFVLLDVFLVIGAIEAITICLQGVGVLPSFWGNLYAVYGPRTFSATLGPNRTMPGHMMIVVLAVAMAYWRNVRAVGFARLSLAAITGVAALAALGVTGSRTAWTTFAVFCLASLMGQRLQGGMIAFVAVLAISAGVFLPDSIEDRIVEQYEWKITAKLDTVAPDSNALDKFQSVDAGRYKLWNKGLAVLIERPWLIPFGGGFNNYQQVSDGASAHNIYITLVTECGIIGLYLYMMWLIWIWRESSRATTLAKKAKGQRRRAFVPSEVRPLLVAIAVSLFAGEIVYPYRPCFSFMGVFLFLVAVLNHRALVLGVTVAESGRRELDRSSVRSDVARRYEDGIPRRAGTGTFAKV